MKCALWLRKYSTRRRVTSILRLILLRSLVVRFWRFVIWPIRPFFSRRFYVTCLTEFLRSSTSLLSRLFKTNIIIVFGRFFLIYSRYKRKKGLSLHTFCQVSFQVVLTILWIFHSKIHSFCFKMYTSS